MDSIKNIGFADLDQINSGENYETEYWSTKLGVSTWQLKAMVEVVGNSAAEVKKHLKK